MNKTKCISHSVFGFWCFHARAASHAPKYCAAAAALLLLLLAALSFWDFRCAFCCAPAATAALSSLSPCQHSVSLMLLSQSCCPPVYIIYMCERASTVRSTFFSLIWVFSKFNSGKKSTNFTIYPFLVTSNNSAFWPFFAKKNSGSTAVNTHILSGCLSLAALSVLLPSHVYNFYVWVCESPRTACCVCTYVCVCV